MPKLIRDKIPQIIRDSGKTCVAYIATPEEYKYFLREKLKEEMNELLVEPCAEEFADLIEVVNAYAASLGITQEQLKDTGRNKRVERGAFDCGIILEQVENKKF